MLIHDEIKLEISHMLVNQLKEHMKISNFLYDMSSLYIFTP